MHFVRVGLFKERKTKFLLLSLISAVVVVSTAFVGFPIYAQSDDSDLTTFEEEAVNAGAAMEDNGLENENATSIASDNTTSADTGNTTERSTSIAEVSSLFEGLQICKLGTAVISGVTQTAAVDESSGTTPTVSVKVMTETEVAELGSNATETASTENGTSGASADCILAGGENSTSTAGNSTTSAASNNTTLTGNATGTVNAIGMSNATSLGASNETSISSAPESNDQILVIEGQDFVPGQVVLIYSGNALIGIDDVDSGGSIEAKVPMPSGGETTTASNDTSSNSTELRFVESGTQRSTNFEFDGQTLTAPTGSDIKAEDNSGSNGATSPAAIPSGNETSTNDTSTMNNTSNSSNSTPQN
jgi:hypothetical protein